MVKVVGNSQGQIYTSNGKALQSTGTSPVIDNLTVIPSTSSQTITAPEGINGYNPITVNAVTSDIDQNLIASNIKKNVEILGVTGDYEGIIPSGTLNITSNNNYDVTNYANANVNVPISGFTDIPSYEINNGTLKRKTYTLTGHEFDNVTTISGYGLYYAFYSNNKTNKLIGTLDLSSLNTVGSYGLYYAFYNNEITTINLSSLNTVSYYGLSHAFCANDTLTGTLDLSSLTTVNNFGLEYAFAGSILTGTLDLSSLTTVNSNGLSAAFASTRITTVNLSSLNTIGNKGLYTTFRGCKELENVYFNALTSTSFGSYTNQFDYLLWETGTNVTHTLHFPSNLESTIQGLTDYPLFSGTSGYVVLAFDLPATS